MPRRDLSTFLAILVVVAPSASVSAQTARSGGGADPRLIQQLQQATAERSALQAENARLKQQLEELHKQASSGGADQEALERRARAAEANVSRLTASNAANAESAQKLRTQMDELVVRFRETAKTLRDVELQRNALEQQLQADGRTLAACRTHNAQLLEINEEVLVRLENTGFWTKLAADEPFTRLKRTELENLANEYRARAAELAEPRSTTTLTR